MGREIRLKKGRICANIVGLMSAFSAAWAGVAMARTERPGPSVAKVAGVGVYNIRDHGAVGDGNTPDTAALQAAIDACAKDQGGTVLVPAGVFVIGTTELKSSVTLRIAAAGKLLGSRDATQYHATPGVPTTGDATMGDGNWALIYATNATNVRVEGPGTIDGGGPPPEGIRGNHRPYALLFHRCRNVVVQNIEMIRCPFHMIRLNQSAYLRLEGINIHNRVAVNDDGFHFVSCEYVNISNCNVLSQDDGCACLAVASM